MRAPSARREGGSGNPLRLFHGSLAVSRLALSTHGSIPSGILDDVVAGLEIDQVAQVIVYMQGATIVNYQMEPLADRACALPADLGALCPWTTPLADPPYSHAFFLDSRLGLAPSPLDVHCEWQPLACVGSFTPRLGWAMRWPLSAQRQVVTSSMLKAVL